MGLAYKSFNFLLYFFNEFWEFFTNQFYIRVFVPETKLRDFFSFYNNLFIFNVFLKARSMNKNFLIFLRRLFKNVRRFFIDWLIGFSPTLGNWESFALTLTPKHELNACQTLRPGKKTIWIIWPCDLWSDPVWALYISFSVGF